MSREVFSRETKDVSATWDRGCFWSDGSHTPQTLLLRFFAIPGELGDPLFLPSLEPGKKYRVVVEEVDG